MSLPSVLVDLISKVAPALAGMLGGPLGGVVGSLISSVLGGVDMQDTQKVVQILQNPESVQKLKELELQLKDLQDARDQAAKAEGYSKLFYPILAIMAHVAIVVDVFLIDNVVNSMLQQILILFLVILVWDIRKIYSFYFGGSSDDLPSVPFLNNKKGR